MAEPFRQFTSKVVPLPAENVDTDQVVPARYLKITDKADLANALFRDWRFNDDGTLKDPPFVLDRPEMAGRQILLVGDNFGTGSSREHAPWALTAWGIRAVFSTSFADIFRSNALKNGVLPIVVDPATHAKLFAIVEANPDARLTVDLAEQGVLLPDGSTLDFDIDPVREADAPRRHRRDRLRRGQAARDRGLGGRPPRPRRHPDRHAARRRLRRALGPARASRGGRDDPGCAPRRAGAARAGRRVRGEATGRLRERAAIEGQMGQVLADDSADPRVPAETQGPFWYLAGEAGHPAAGERSPPSHRAAS